MYLDICNNAEIFYEGKNVFALNIFIPPLIISTSSAQLRKKVWTGS